MKIQKDRNIKIRNVKMYKYYITEVEKRKYEKNHIFLPFFSFEEEFQFFLVPNAKLTS